MAHFADVGLNKPARKAAAKELGVDVEIDAILLVSPTIVAGKAVGFSAGKPGTSVYTTEYAEGRGIAPDATGVRHDLHPGWLTLTADELIFHYPGMRGLRPGPVEVIDRLPRDGARLAWFDLYTKAQITRVLHLEFADDSRFLTATAYGAPNKRRPFDDEADRLIEAFGDRAERIDVR